MDWNSLGTNIGDWFGTSQAPIVLGDAAAALMGSQQNSWQAGLGKLASGLGKSKIANDRLTEQQTQNNQFRKMLMQYLSGTPGTGVGLTPEGIAGDTDVTMKKNADGTYTKTVKGNMNQTGEQERMVQPTRQVQQPSQPEIGRSDFRSNPGLIPLF